MYCASLTTNLDDLWEHVIASELTDSGNDIRTVVSVVAAVARPQRAKNADIPLRAYPLVGFVFVILPPSFGI